MQPQKLPFNLSRLQQSEQNPQLLQQQIPTPLVPQSQLIQSHPQIITQQQQRLQQQTLPPQLVNTSMSQIIVNPGMPVTLNGPSLLPTIGIRYNISVDSITCSRSTIITLTGPNTPNASFIAPPVPQDTLLAFNLCNDGQ